MRRGSLVPPWVTFPEASLRSRTDGFPISGSDLGSAAICPIFTFPAHPRLKRRLAYPSRLVGLRRPSRSSALRRGSSAVSGGAKPATAAEYPEPLCLALGQGVLTTPRRALLLLLRSYGLMRQTIHLRWPMVFPRARGLCRLSPVPADGWSFPILSLHSLRRRLDPYPAVPSGCACPFLPHRHRPCVTRNTLGETELSLSCNFSREPFFRGCSHSPPSGSYAR